MKRPIVLAAICWLAGTAVALQQWWSIAIIIGIVLFIWGIRLRTAWHKGVWLGMGAFVLATGWSAVYDHLQQTMIGDEHEQWFENERVVAQGKIVSRVDVDGDRASFTMQLYKLYVDGYTMELPQYGLRRETVQTVVRLENRMQQMEMLHRERGEILTVRGQLQKPGVARNFGAFDYREFLRWKGVHWVMEVRGLSGVNVGTGERFDGHRLLSFVDRWRTLWARQIDRIFSPETSGWMKSMTVGLRDDLHPEQFEQFAKIGMTHILAISGLHVGVFLSAVTVIFMLVGVRRDLRLTLCIWIIPFYIVFTGAAPSVLRAGMMAMAGLYALKRKRLKDGLGIVSGTGVILLAWNPYFLFDISFQLSFAVTIGLIVLVPLWLRLFPLPNKWLSGTVAVTSVAEIISFPLTVYYFHHFSLFSWLANLLLVPLISFAVIPGALAATVISWLYMPAGAQLATGVEHVNRFVLNAVHVLNYYDPFYVHWPEPSLLWIALYFGLTFLLLVTWEWHRSVRSRTYAPLDTGYGRYRFALNRKRHEWPLWIVLLCALLWAMVLLYGYAPHKWDANGSVHFMDVGQGDAILIRTPSGKTVLLDAGGTFRFGGNRDEWRVRRDPFEVGKDVVVPLLQSRGVQRLDYVIISHHDHDHIGGMQAVLENVPVGQVLFNGTLKEQDVVKDLFRTALLRNIPLYTASAGESLTLDSDTSLQFLYPFAPTAYVDNESEGSLAWSDEQNDQSLVFLMKMYDSTFLFTGDIEARGEMEWLERWELELNHEVIAEKFAYVDVMKAAHHGSKSSTTEAWMSYWRPRITVISAGSSNLYGHPHEEVLQRLSKYKSTVYRTDQDGEVQFRVRPHQLEVRTMLGTD